MKKILLHVKNLCTYFFTDKGIVKAVDGVSFFVYEGETFGLVGESGCGKTVTAYSILRLLPKKSGRIVKGEILFDGVNLLELSEKEMRTYRGREISMILQDPMVSLNPVYPIGEQIAEAVRLHQKLPKEEVKNKVISALKLLGVPSPEVLLNQYPFQLSGGMRQRVVGAIAMSCNPRLLIADEPTTALDATIQAQFLALLRDIQRKTKVSIIFITHDFGVVARMCHRVGVMYAGKIVEMAGKEEIFNAPKHPYTIALINSVPRLDRKTERLYSIEGQPPSLIDPPSGCGFSPRCPFAMEVCQKGTPPLIEIGEDHHVACFMVKNAST